MEQETRMGTDICAGLERSALRQLSARSDARGTLQLSFHAALLCATGVLIRSTGGAMLALALLLHGVVLNCLFCALHESVHGTAFASRRLNQAVSSLCGWILLLPAHYFRLFHFAHHQYTQQPDQDPELAIAKPASIAGYAWHVSGLPNWHNRLKITSRHALLGHVNQPFVPSGKHRAIVREARLLWAGYLAAFVASIILRRTELLMYWLIPLILGQPFLRMFLLAEHTGCDLGDDGYTNTRTTRTNLVVRLLTWRMSFHIEHHLHPSVPFFRLSAVRSSMAVRLPSPTPGYVAFHRRLLRQMRLRKHPEGLTPDSSP
jgi:fatty acid desaturase